MNTAKLQWVPGGLVGLFLGLYGEAALAQFGNDSQRETTFTTDEAFHRTSEDSSALPQLLPGISNEGLAFLLLLGVLIIGMIAIMVRGWSMNDERARVETALRKAAKMRGESPESVGEGTAPVKTAPPRRSRTGSFSERADALRTQSKT